MARTDKRHQIMLAAEKLFTNRRFHEVTLDMVAAEARVGKGTIYRFFQDKEDLFFQTATSGFDELCDLIDARAPESESYDERLLAACRQIDAYVERRRQLIRMMEAEESRVMWQKSGIRERWVANRARLINVVGAIIRRGMEEGRVRSDVPAEVLATYLVGMLRTRARDLAEVGPGHQSFELTLDIFHRGACCASKTNTCDEAERS